MSNPNEIDPMLNAKDSAEYPNVERYCERCGDDVYVRGELLCTECRVLYFEDERP